MKLGYEDFEVTGVHIQHKIYEAPKNGGIYARSNGKWVLIKESYSKLEIDKLLSKTPGIDDSYILDLLSTKVYTKEEIDTKIKNIPTYNAEPLILLINSKLENIYTKEESDNRYLLKGSLLVEETDPTVPDWAKQPTKPNYTAEEVGAISIAMLPELNSGIIYTTEEEYENMEIDNNKFYICLEDEEILKIYLGQYLIANKRTDGNVGFPYSLPITF